MGFAFLKRFMPIGLYGRAALILIVPIVTIQLVVSIAFIQRHFEDVTRQMTQNVALELAVLQDRVAAAPDREVAYRAVEILGADLMMEVSLPDTGQARGFQRVFYDFSGRQVFATLTERIPAVRAIDLRDLRRVHVVIDTRHGPLGVEFSRRRVSASNPHQLLVLMLLTGLLMTAIAFVFLRNQLRPIRRLAAAAGEYGRGRLVPYRPTGAIEVRAAGNAFLDMRARLERQKEQRTLLLSGVSHDLRTPLTRLRLGLAMLGDDAEAEAMLRDLNDMERLLDAFLAFVRDDARDEVASPVDPVPLVRAIVEDARRAGQEVVLFSVEGEGEAQLRVGAIRRAMDNLIGNAVRYGNRAEVSLAIMDRSIRLSVEDDGPGIPRARREEALRPFTRLDGARNQDRGSGVGLGLAITADIARNHGGILRLGESARLGGLRADLVLAR